MSCPAGDPIDGVTFDVGETLITARPSVGAVYASVCREHGLDLPVDACDRFFEEAWERRSAETPPGRDRFGSVPGGEKAWWGALVLEVLERCGVPSVKAPPVQAFLGAFASPEAWSVYDDARDALEALRAGGYRLAALSNWDSRLPGLLERLDLSKYFDAIICSAMAGMEKPDRRLFAMAARALGLPPSRIAHVGDRLLEDYRGARAAGMLALWLDRRADGRPGPPEVPPDHAIRSLAQVMDRLEEERRRAACRP